MAVNYFGYSFSDQNAFMYMEIGQLYGMLAAISHRTVSQPQELHHLKNIEGLFPY